MNFQSLRWLTFTKRAGALIGAYVGGSAVNNDWTPWNGGWDWEDPATYFGIIGGGVAGGIGAQWMFGTEGVLAGGSSVNVSLGATFDKIGTTFANISIGGGSGLTFEGAGYVTAAGGGAYVTVNTLNKWLNRNDASDGGGSPNGYNPYSQPGDQFWIEFNMAAAAFVSNYRDMRGANTVGADKYFHCKANFQAASYGPGGVFFAEHFSNLREIWDQNVKGYPRWDSVNDQEANKWGRDQVGVTTDPCEACEKYGPNGLPDYY